MKSTIWFALSLLIFAGCKKDESLAPLTPPTGIFFISGNFEGNDFKWEAGQYDFNTYVTYSTATNLQIYTCSFMQGQKLISIGMSIPFSGSKPDMAFFTGLFKAGDRTFIYPGSQIGINMEYFNDPDRANSYFSGVQPSTSYFRITSSKKRVYNGKTFMDVKGEFDCMVHPYDMGPDSRFKNGKFYCSFVDE